MPERDWRYVADQRKGEIHRLMVEAKLMREHLEAAHAEIHALRAEQLIERAAVLTSIELFLHTFDKLATSLVSRRIVKAAEKLRETGFLLRAHGAESLLIPRDDAAPTHQEPVEPPKDEDHPHTGGKGFNSP